MDDRRLLKELIKRSKRCAEIQTGHRELIEQFHSDLKLLLKTVFPMNNSPMTEKVFMGQLASLQYITFSLSSVVERKKFTCEEIHELLRSVFDAICSVKSSELARSFDKLIHVILRAASKLSHDEYHTTVMKVLDTFKYCLPSTSGCTEEYPMFFSASVISVVCDDLKIVFADNILAALLAANLPSVEYFDTLWSDCRENLNNVTTSKHILNIENCLKIGVKVLNYKSETESIVEQAKLINEFFTVFESFKPKKVELIGVLTKLFQLVQKFIEDRGNVLMLRKEMRGNTLRWIVIYISLIAEDADEFGLLETFSNWLIELNEIPEIQEVPPASCIVLIEKCVERIGKSLSSQTPDCLPHYMDILACVFKLSKVHSEPQWSSIAAEIEKHSFFENPQWPRLLCSLLNTRHPSSYQFCRKFIPSINELWIKIQNGDSARQTVYSIAFILATYPGYDEGAKHTLPILLLPCFHDFRERVGVKRDNFRFIGGGRGTPSELRDLEKYTKILDYKNSESVKLQAINCALLIEKKTTSYVGLIVDMALAVFIKSQTNEIVNCLPALVHFLTEHPSYINDFLECLTAKLGENFSVFTPETIEKLCESVQHLICFSVGRKIQCPTCEKNRNKYVEPEAVENIRVNERSLALFVKGMMENLQKYSEKTISKVLGMCRAILIHVESSLLPTVFTPVIKALTIAFSSNSNCYFRIWELINVRSTANDGKKLQIYIPVLTRTFFSLSSTKPKVFNDFMKKLSDAKLSETVKVSVVSVFFAHAVVTNSAINWNVFSNRIRYFARELNESYGSLMEDELLQSVVKRYSTIFTRCFLSRIIFESSIDEHFDEAKIRETVRSFVLNIMIHFKFPNLVSALIVLRPTLLYWTLLSGARGQNPKHVCTIVDFMCQELAVASANHVMINQNDGNIVITQRKGLIIEMFQHIVQQWAFESCKGNDVLWKFCQDHCGFSENDMKAAISSYRKGVFERFLLVSPEIFLNSLESSFIAFELQKTYEYLKKGEKFSITTAMDTRREGTEFLFTFRSYFTEDIHFWMRERAAACFRVILQHVKPDFFDSHWWIILATLRYCPNHLESTRLTWIHFVETLNYNILRTNIWRILTDLSRVENNSSVLEAIWNRVRYANEIEKIASDGMMRRIFWIIPLEVEKKVDFDFTIAKSRKIDDVFEFIRQFPRYPSLHFVGNLSSKIDRGTVWKDDLPKLIGAITGILPACQSDRQRNEICSILHKVPIFNSELADQTFSRWNSSAFFSEPIQLTQAVLEECSIVVETMSAEGRVAYADRTMCEVQKFFMDSVKDLENRSSLACLRDMYSTMNCQKPEPPLIELKNVDELSMRLGSPARWFTLFIVECAQKVTINSPLLSLIPIAHINDQRFLAKLSMRFILTVIHKGMEPVSQWILTVFENALLTATHRTVSKTGRVAASFIFYVFDFLYYYLNSEEVRKEKAVWGSVYQFWKNMLDWTIIDEHGHEQPLIVKVAASFGMEKRCILWMELYMVQLTNKKGKNEKIENEKEAAYYFTLMNLYARIHELNGVRGSFARLSKAHTGHVYGKICLNEAFGDVASAATLSKMTGKGRPFDPVEEIQKLMEEHERAEILSNDKEDQEEQMKSLRNLTKWIKEDQNFGPSPQVFSKTIEYRAMEATILTMIQNEEDDDVIDKVIEKTRMLTLERLSECAIGGSCSYETATTFIVQINQLDEICRLKNASVESLIGVEPELWNTLQKKTEESERMDVLEPILRVRRSMLTMRMKKLGEYKEEIRLRIVESHLQSARIARLTGCQERAQLAIINAKKVMPFDNRIVLEEAKLQLQTSDELSGMNLLDGIIDKTFGELSKHYGDTQQSRNLDLQKSARSMIESCPAETKNLFSSVQMLRISHMIKAGNTIGFEKIYNDTTNLLHSFVSSGVMYEAAWLLDYLFHHNERNRHVLPLLKSYTEVAKFEKNHVLQARAVERMMSLWLSNTKKINHLISSAKVPANAAPDMVQNIKTMNREITNALDRIGHRAFYPAYAVLARHIDHPDEDVFRTIKHIMQQLIFKMPHQCMWQSVYLLRQDIAVVKNRYMDILTSVKRKSAIFTSLIDQYDYASAVFNSIPGKVSSEQHGKLSEKVKGLQLLFRESKYDPKELVIDRRIDGECKTVCGIMVPIRSEIGGSLQTMEFSENFEDPCMIADRYLIHDFSDNVKVLLSKTKPVLIELITKAGRKVRLICKKEDDLTKDYYFTKMVEMCNDLLIKDEQTRIQNMAATTYSVIPLAQYGGVLEFIEGVVPFYETLQKHLDKTGAEWSSQIQKWAVHMKTLSKEKKLEFFRSEMCEKTPIVMAKWFRCEYPEAGKWFASRKLFAKSSAVMSMIGYIFGLGDRHTRNIMVHVPTGKCVHVDFDMIFNKGELLGTPEVVPFRLTRNMINGMGEVGLDGEFRSVCEQSLRVFRENSYEIEKYIADLPNLVSDFNLKDFDMTEAKRLISGRLRGQIMTAKVYRSNPISHPMQVSQLASSLIELATSDEKLCEMFEGWMPTL